MTTQKPSKYTINYTTEDEKNALINLFIQLIVSRDHPEIINTAEQLACKYIKQHEQSS